MAQIVALHHMSLTVTDLARSTDWYTAVLGFSLDTEVQGETFRRNRLRHPEAGFTLSLTRHDDGTGESFRETRPGLDHVAFLTRSVADVEGWKQRLEQLGVEHLEIKRRPGGVAMITFRDPDHIQLEVMALAG